jgi:hypothetical protein
MNSFFIILLALAMLAVLASLGIGLFAMARGKEQDAKLSQRMMRFRVILQLVALVCFILAALAGRG